MVAICAAAGVLAFAALLFSIVRLVRCLRSAIEATIALREAMQVKLPSAGDKVLYLKAPRGTAVHKLVLDMRDAQGNVVALERILFPWVVSGVGDVRVSYARLKLAATGRYALTAQNIPESTRPMELVFSRPNLAATIGWILAIVVSGNALVAAIVAGALSAQG